VKMEGFNFMISKTSANKRGTRAAVKKYWWVFLVVVMVVSSVGVVGYNKYLDAQNVTDMKQLLADFEQLERDVEAETGESLYIKANCGNVGKFATSYSCSLRLLHSEELWSAKIAKAVASKETANMKGFGGCKMLSESSVGFEPNEDNYICVISTRGSNESKAEEIFYLYDTSPGSPVRAP